MRDKAVFQALCTFCVALLAVAAIVASKPSLDWGDVPTWVAGFIAVMALLAARRAGNTALALLEIERKRLNRSEDRERAEADLAERKEQADLVAAWTVHQGVDGEGVDLGTYVNNASALPIWDVELDIYAPNGTFREKTGIGVVPPGGVYRRWSRPVLREAVKCEGLTASNASVLGPEYRVAIRFRDAANRQWQRNQYGELRKTGIAAFPTATGSIELFGSAGGMRGVYRDPPNESEGDQVS